MGDLTVSCLTSGLCVRRSFDLAMLDVAAEYAVRPDMRDHHIGAVGQRRDGAIVLSRNGNSHQPIPSSHAEHRLCRKLDAHACVWVVRVRSSSEYGLAKPCVTCMKKLVDKRVRRVAYSITTDAYGVINI